MAEANGYLIAAFVVMWVGLIGYALKLHRVYRDAERRLDEASQGQERKA